MKSIIPVNWSRLRLFHALKANVAGFFFSAKREKKNPFSTFYGGEGNNLLGVPILSSGIVASNKWCEGASEEFTLKISRMIRRQF